MKSLSFIFPVVLLLAASCGSDKPDITKPAITGIPTPVYDGMIAVMKGEIMTTLPPQKMVYLQSATLTVNNAEFVKVAWGDSSGYVPQGWLMEGGAAGIVYASETEPVTIFSDTRFQNTVSSAIIFPQTISYKQGADGVTEVMYMADDSSVATGFIRPTPITDSVAFELLKEYKKAYDFMADSNPAPMEALSHDSRYASSQLFSLIFRMERTDPTAGGKHTEMEWTDKDGNRVPPDEAPGVFALHYIWMDGTESEENHLGDDLEQGIPTCNPEKDAKAFKMVFTPGEDMSVEMKTDIPMLRDDKDGIYVKNFEAKAGEKLEYLITHRVYTVVCDETTFTVKTSTGYTGTGKVVGSCGD